MAVYTSVDEKQIDEFLKKYSVGYLLSFVGIKSGIENTNYFIETSLGLFVLTIYEEMTVDQIPFFLGLVEHLSNDGVPVMVPVKLKNGALLSSIAGKPAALIERLSGGNVVFPNESHCSSIGKALARMHISVQSYHKTHDDHNIQTEMLKIDRDDVFNSLTQSDRKIFKKEMDNYNTFRLLSHSLPKGVIHADLFRDNCLFDVENNEVKLSGIIDFYYACDDLLLYDLAIVVSDWCFDSQGNLDEVRYLALLHGYSSLRPLNAEEKKYWYSVLRASLLLFWGHRILFKLCPKQGELVGIKDPDELKLKIKWCLSNKNMLDASVLTL